jgi:hypothetical protein
MKIFNTNLLVAALLIFTFTSCSKKEVGDQVKVGDFSYSYQRLPDRHMKGYLYKIRIIEDGDTSHFLLHTNGNHSGSTLVKY